MKTLKDYETIEEICASRGMICPVTPEEKLRFRYLWSNRHKSFANCALHIEFGMECLNKWCGMCGFHSSAEIRGEREAIEQ